MRLGRVGQTRVNSSSEIVKLGCDDIPVVRFVPDVDIEDDKSFERYTKACKSYIRKSREYRGLMQFIKFDMDNGNKCMFLQNVEQQRGSKIKIEMHHVVCTITDIIKTVIRKLVYQGLPVNQEVIGHIVMRLHYEGIIGIVPLCTTMHKLIHCEDSTLFIPIQNTFFGKPIKFYEEYQEFMDDKLVKKVEQYLTMSQAVIDIEETIPDYLDTHYIY